ncbi:MAG TPA: prepilin-type N-terminal cleavage/methylation domain-containing protein [Planctomycetota bacterium]|nr:prepilin-type N-terminal cleavage/methylation domain-containing protein [Planctomycetota bacterium]
MSAPPAPPPTPSLKGRGKQLRGLTLLEVMVTLVIFLVMALAMFAMISQLVAGWGQSERRRVLYEKAAGVVNVIASDLRLALTHEAPGATEVKVRFIGDYNRNTSAQTVAFVRAFEYGPERAITFFAGDGAANPLMFSAGTDPDDPDKKPVPKLTKNTGNADRDTFDGRRVGDFKALGGMAAVGYFVQNETLYRAIRSPVPQSLNSIMNVAGAQVIATDVLYFAIDYWGQETTSWDEPKGKNLSGGPEKFWDSTRGIDAYPFNRFFLYRGPISLNDPEDDVFPEKVRFTVTIDSPMPRCIWTRLQDDIEEGTTTIMVEDTRGFPDGGDDSFIKIGDEWMQLKKRTQDTFVIAKRGVRGTKALGHKAGAVVRAGRTFTRVVHIPNFRSDFSSDDVYFARKGGSQKPKRLTQ